MSPDLGQVKSTHRGSPWHIAGGIVLGVASLVVAAGMVRAVLHDPEKLIIGSLLAALMVLGGAYLIYLAIAIARTTVVVAEKGLTKQLGAQLQVMRWDEVTHVSAVYERRSRNLLKWGQATKRTKTLILHAEGDRRVVLASSLTDFEGIAALLRLRVLTPEDED